MSNKILPKKQSKMYHPVYSEFKAFLARKNIKLKEIADLLNCTVQTISMKNNGYADYSGNEINIICDYFKTSTEIFRTQKVS